VRTKPAEWQGLLPGHKKKGFGQATKNVPRDRTRVRAVWRVGGRWWWVGGGVTCGGGAGGLAVFPNSCLQGVTDGRSCSYKSLAKNTEGSHFEVDPMSL
jgi:hypothetical protein